MNPPSKILITGANGFTGQHACKHFVETGFDVIAVIRKGNFFYKQVQVEKCDLTNKEMVQNLIKKVQPDYVLHLAGQNHVGNSWITPVNSLEVNTMSTAYLLESIRQENLKCKTLIVGSALQFDPSDISTLHHPYSLSKTLQSVVAQAWSSLYNLDVLIARPSNLVGPGPSKGVCSVIAQRIVSMERKQLLPVLELENPNVCRDFLDVRDVVVAYEVLLKKGRNQEVYDISSGIIYSLKEITELFQSLSQAEFEVKVKTNNLIPPPKRVLPLKMRSLGWNVTIPLPRSLEETLNFYREK